jgi:hypothetical protein
MKRRDQFVLGIALALAGLVFMLFLGVVIGAALRFAGR